MNIRPYRANLLDTNGFNDFYSLIDSFFNDGWAPEAALKRSSFKVDIAEDDKAYTVEAEMPGISKDNIDIRLEEGHLTLTVQDSEETEDQDKTYIHRERKASKMSRTMFFKDIDEEGLKAKLKDGILEITLPKKAAEEKSKKIEIED